MAIQKEKEKICLKLQELVPGGKINLKDTFAALQQAKQLSHNINNEQL